jgi:hypothetical protein
LPVGRPCRPRGIVNRVVGQHGVIAGRNQRGSRCPCGCGRFIGALIRLSPRFGVRLIHQGIVRSCRQPGDKRLCVVCGDVFAGGVV